MLCANYASRRIRVSSGLGPALSVNKKHVRSKNDVFPIPPSFKLSEAARAGRQLQKPQPRKSTQPHGPSLDPRRVSARDLAPPVPVRLSPTAATPARTIQVDGPRNAVEADIKTHAPRVLGLYPRLPFRTGHPDLYDFMPARVEMDSFKGDSLKLFFNAFNDLLPADPLNTRGIVTPKGSLHRISYHKKSPQSSYETNKMPLHGHLITCNYPINSEKLLPDGTDTRFLPGPSAVWQSRLWAGGSISVHSHLHRGYDSSDIYYMVERPIDMRVVGKDRPERVFVKVQKSFYTFDYDMPLAVYTKDKILDLLEQRPKYGLDKRNGLTSNVLRGGPVFEEEYELCFLRGPPNLSDLSAKVVRPPENPKFTHILKPNRHLLFCWSAITYNAHLIHLDPTFARNEYGAVDLVVHGPLTLFLVLEWFERQLTTYAKNNGLGTFQLRSINYKNLLPLYVDQQMKLCMKPSEFPTPGQLAPKWDVWIEKELENGVGTMAFKGQILVQRDAARFQQPALEEPQKRRGPLQDVTDTFHRGTEEPPPPEVKKTRSEKPNTWKPMSEKPEKPEKEEAITFESPFFP